MATHPVTNAQYLVFLNALLEDGREGEALQWVPRERSGQHGQQGASIYGRDPNGHFVLVPDTDGVMWNPDWPVCSVIGTVPIPMRRGIRAHRQKLAPSLSWNGKGSQRGGQAWYPWGDGDPSYLCTESHQDGREPALISDYPIDEFTWGSRMAVIWDRQPLIIADWTALVSTMLDEAAIGMPVLHPAHQHFYNLSQWTDWFSLWDY